MRKLAVLMMVCMLMTAFSGAAMAAVVMQDEQPPKVVEQIGENGAIVIAKIYDKDGNLITEILNDGSLTIVDVHNRQDDHGSSSISRLTKVYEDIMAQVHHGDVECKLHDHDVKVCVNDVLASLQADLDAHDLVMFELFDVMQSDAIKALLVDGNYMEVTFETAEQQGLPLITMFSSNGSEWEVLPTTQVNDKQFTVQLRESGTLALMADGNKLMNFGGSSQTPELGDDDSNSGQTPGTGSFSDGVNGNFTPSVSGKMGPEFVSFVGEDGKTYVGYIYGKDGKPMMMVADDNYLQVTSVAGRSYIGDIQTYEHLQWAYDSILNAEDVGDLYTEHGDDMIADEDHTTLADVLDAVLAQMNLPFNHDQLVVKELFEVTAYGDYLHALYDEESYLKVTFKTTIDPQKPLVVIHSSDSVHWHVHPIEEFAVGEDGTVTLNMYELGVVAFLVEEEYQVDSEGAVQAP